MSLLERAARRLMPPPEPPDLLRESARRAERALQAREALGPETWPYIELPATKGWPDPYGPDPVVFGPGPEGERC